MKTLATFLILLSSLFINAQNPPMPTVDVSGQGTVKVVPDEATITVRVEHTGNNPKEVKQMNDQTVNEVFQFLKKQDIEEKYITSQQINLSKNYDYNTKKYSYVANQTISVFLTDLSKYESLMKGLLETGINRINSVTFSSSEMKKLESEARVKAIMDAKQKAMEYASALGQNIGKAVHITEFNNVSTPMPVLRSMAMEGDSKMQTMAPGEMEINAQVNVSFELK